MRCRLATSVAWLSLAAACSGPAPEVPAFDTAAAEPAVAHRLAELRATVSAHPDSGPAWGRLALSLQAHGYFEAALETYEIARDVKPGVFAYSYLPALILADRGDPAAGKLFEAARDQRPDYSPLLLREAEWLVDQGRASEAPVLLDGSAAAREAPAHANLLLGRAALALGDTARARTRLEAALQSSPAFGAVHAQLTDVYRRNGNAAAADLAARRAAIYPELAPLDDPVQAALAGEGVSSRWHILRGQAYMRSAEAAAAVEEFEAAAGTLPGDALVANQLGLALQAAGRFGDAIREHGRALQLRPEFNEARVAAAHALFRNRQVDSAFTEVRLAIEADSASADAYLALGMFEQATGRPRESANALAAGLGAAGFDRRIALRLAWLSATSRIAAVRDGRQAVVLAQTANELESFSDPGSLDVLAAAYAEFGDFARARAAAERAVAIAALQGNRPLERSIQSRLAAYERGEAYRE